jgi:hypothetical protein
MRIMVHHIRKKTEHLGEKEREKFERLKALYFRINNNLTKQKRLAFGKKMGRIPDVLKDGSILEVRKVELLELFGKMYDIADVLKIVNMEWGIPINHQNLMGFKVKYQDDIRKLVDIHKTSYHNIRLGIKKSRLEELSYIYKKAKETWTDANKREDLKVLLTILEQIRKEAEGDKLTIEGKVDISYEHNINDHLMKEVFATTNLKEIILGRVAAKMGVNPVRLMFSLQNSYYKKFSNVLGDMDEKDQDGMIYPSQLSYDFERIGKKFLARDREIEDAVIVDEKENDKDQEKANKIKEALAQRLKEKNNLLRAFRDRVDTETAERDANETESDKVKRYKSDKRSNNNKKPKT